MLRGAVMLYLTVLCTADWQIGIIDPAGCCGKCVMAGDEWSAAFRLEADAEEERIQLQDLATAGRLGVLWSVLAPEGGSFNLETLVKHNLLSNASFPSIDKRVFLAIQVIDVLEDILLKEVMVSYVINEFESLKGEDQRASSSEVISRLRTVEFVAHVYEGSYREFLKSGILEENLNRNNYTFSRRVLYVEQVLDRDHVLQMAQPLIESNILDEVFFMDDDREQVLDFFEIDRVRFGHGIVYSMIHLSALYHAQSDYIVFFSDDCLLQGTSDWISPALRVFDEYPHTMLIASPIPNGDFSFPRAERCFEAEDYTLTLGMSDTVYMIDVAKARHPIYNEQHEAQARFPLRGESRDRFSCWESRLDSWMKNHKKFKAYIHTAAYLHPVAHYDNYRSKWEKEREKI